MRTREQKLQYWRDYYQKNKEKRIAYVKTWARKNSEKRKAIKDRWRSRNREMTNFYTRKYQRQRKGANKGHTREDETDIYKAFPICPYCNIALSDTIDHLDPLSKGGGDEKENLIACCRSCNSKKGAKTLFEFKPLLFIQWDRLATHS